MHSQRRVVDYIYIFVKWRKFIILNSFIIAVIAAGVSMVIPRWYRASTTILPPQEDSQGIGFSSILSSLPLSSLGLGGMSEGTTRFLALMDSRTIMESVAKEFDLQKLYKEKNMEETVKELRKHVSVNVDEQGTISLSIEAATPYFASPSRNNQARMLARDMTNFFVSKLDSLNKFLKAQKAHNTRMFIEKRYVQNQEDLRNAEIAMKNFQDEKGAIALPEQITATISAAAEIEGQIVAKEIELKVMQKYAGSSHSEVVRLKNEIKALKDKFNEMNNGKNKNVNRPSDTEDDIFLPLNNLPDLALNFARLYREVKIQEKIQEFLLPQYEQAKIQEAKDTPTLQVLDKAVIPIKRAKPKRAFFVIFFAFIACLLSCSYVIFYEYIEKIKNSQNSAFQKEKEIIDTISNDLSRLFNRNKK